jgi:hypothetical protein
MTTAIHGFSIRTTAFADPALRSRRRVSHRAGRAIRLLGHAIEYVANEFLHDSHPPSAQMGRLEAVHILKVLNAEVYSECPELTGPPTFGERCGRLLVLRRG